MVRLVFRPYTQVRRTICTSVSLRASIRVSPDFTLLRHSSPSFGSQHICSYSNLSQANDRSMVPPLPLSERVPTSAPRGRLYFHCASGFSTQILAHMLDSLVRVSRRVNNNHFVSITSNVFYPTGTSTTLLHRQSFALQAYDAAGNQGASHSGACYRNYLNPVHGMARETITGQRNAGYATPYLSPSFLPQH